MTGTTLAADRGPLSLLFVLALSFVLAACGQPEGPSGEPEPPPGQPDGGAPEPPAGGIDEDAPEAEEPIPLPGPRLQPNPPLLISPAQGSFAAGPGNVAITFEWRYGGTVLESLPAPPPPSHFVVCFFDINYGQECTWPGTYSDNRAPEWVHQDLIGNFDGRAAVPGSSIVTIYSDEPAGGLPASFMDRIVAWTAGACSGTSNSRCAFAEPRRLTVTGRDLVNVDVSDFIDTDGLPKLGIEVANIGVAPSGPFEVGVSVWEVLGNDQYRPRTDVNASDVTGDHIVIMWDGTPQPVRHLDSLAPGNYDNAGVFAIVKPNTQGIFQRITWSAGLDAETPPEDPAEAATWKPNGLTVHEVTLQPSTENNVFAVRVRIDPDGFVLELNKDNNMNVFRARHFGSAN